MSEPKRPRTTPGALLALTQADKPIDLPGIHNVVAYTHNVYSGAGPQGDAGFASLRTMGIKTIISVDGAKPELDRAASQNLRYVHLPFGYDGVPQNRQLEIARAIRDLEHPVYIHCHHGKHRSAAAAASAMVTLGLITREQALARMKVSGTSPRYKGLYKDVRTAHQVTEVDLDAASNAFPTVWQTENMVDAMVAIDAAHDHLKKIAKANWQVPVTHPDLLPASEAGQLADLLRNLKDDEHVLKESHELAESLLQASSYASDLERQLLVDDLQSEKLDALLTRVTQSCRDCHARYRN